MRVALVVGTAMGILLGVGAASAEISEPRNEIFMKDMKETVYATNQHMGFSMRASLIHWLGGVPVANERDVGAAQREKWWGEGVPLLPPDSVPRIQR